MEVLQLYGIPHSDGEGRDGEADSKKQIKEYRHYDYRRSCIEVFKRYESWCFQALTQSADGVDDIWMAKWVVTWIHLFDYTLDFKIHLYVCLNKY